MKRLFLIPLFLILTCAYSFIPVSGYQTANFTKNKTDSTPINLPIYLTQPAAADTTVTITTSGTAKPSTEDYGTGKNYTLSATSVVILTGATSPSSPVTLTVANNPVVDLDKAARITLSAAGNPAFIYLTINVAIIDDARTNLINVKSPGHSLGACVGDGTTDDSASLQAIIDYAQDNSGTIVYFPDGVYIFTGLNLPPGITLLGESKTSTILKRIPGFRAETFDASVVNITDNTITLSYDWGTNDGGTIYLARHSPNTLPTPLIVDHAYYIKRVSDKIIKLSATPGGDEIDLLVAGSGVNYIRYAERMFMTTGTGGYKYSGSVDSSPLVFSNLTIDGNYNNIGDFHRYEQEHCYNLLLMADVTDSGKLVCIVDNVQVQNCITDGITVFSNSKLISYNTSYSECFRGSITPTGGYVEVDLRNAEMNGTQSIYIVRNLLNGYVPAISAFHAEIASGGYNGGGHGNDQVFTLNNVNLNAGGLYLINGSVAPVIKAVLNNVYVNGSYHLQIPATGGYITINNSELNSYAEAFYDGSVNYFAGDFIFDNVIFRSKGKINAGATVLTEGYGLSVSLWQGDNGTLTIRNGSQILGHSSLTDVSGTVYGIKFDGTKLSKNNYVVLNGLTIDSEFFDYAINCLGEYHPAVGYLTLTNVEATIKLDGYFLYLDSHSTDTDQRNMVIVDNPTFNCKYLRWWAPQSAVDSLTHSNFTINQSPQNVIDAHQYFGGIIFGGRRTITGSGAPADTVAGIAGGDGDIYIDGADTYLCTTTGWWNLSIPGKHSSGWTKQ